MNKKSGYALRIVLGGYLTYLGIRILSEMIQQRPPPGAGVVLDRQGHPLLDHLFEQGAAVGPGEADVGLGQRLGLRLRDALSPGGQGLVRVKAPAGQFRKLPLEPF